MKYRELTKKLQALGCHEIPRRGGGSHRKWLNPTLGKGTVIPDWGNKDIKDGTVRAILKQLGISIGDFGRIL